MQQFAKTKFFKVFIIAALLGLLVFMNPRGFFNPLRSGLSFFLLPFQKVFYSVSVGIGETRDFLGSIGQLKKENKELFMKNQDLMVESVKAHDLQNENDMLREQLNLLPRNQYDLVASFVVSQDPNGTGNWLEIDKGKNDGIEEGMAVIFSKGILVGRIREVNDRTSKVILLTNPKSTVNVMTSENGSKGIIKGEYGLGIIFDMILQTDSVQIGDSVITSGVGGQIPRGLYIGTIQEVHPSEDHLFQQAVITTPLQISKLQTVFVVRGEKAL